MLAYYITEYYILTNDWLVIAHYMETDRRTPDYQIRWALDAEYK